MNKKIFFASVFFVSIFLMNKSFAQEQTKIIGYVPIFRPFEPVDYSKLTHLNIAFENPDSTGNLSFDTRDTIYLNEGHKNHLYVMVSIGGGLISETQSEREKYFRLISDGQRSSFVNKISNYLLAHHFDGLDVDLEGAAINEDYGKFIKALSDALKPNGKLLSAALSEGNGGRNVSTETLQLFSFVNVMAYDATGPWNPSISGPHASYDFADKCLDYWLGRGIPKEKTILGVPFYGYGFGKAFTSDGYSYKQIVSEFSDAANVDQIGDTIYYNGLLTIKAKTNLALKKGGGIMIWELTQDAKGQESLLNCIWEEVHSAKNL